MFAHRLAREHRWVNTDAMLRAITTKQFFELQAYYSFEPIGEERADWRAAQIVAMIFNMAVDVKHRKKIKNFLLEFVKDPKPTTQGPREHAAILRAIARAYAVPGQDI